METTPVIIVASTFLIDAYCEPEDKVQLTYDQGTLHLVEAVLLKKLPI
jgi:hypothetical protein